ncbi:MAG: HlyC/CorC family transporter [Acidobacteria bacterium]|nr:HlyC/CorC family transporter [Acidobacteriota bacterium]
MLKVFFVFVLLLRVSVSILRTAFVSFSRIELRQVSEKYPSLGSQLESRARFQLTLSLAADLSLLSAFLLWMLVAGAFQSFFSIESLVIVPLVYLVLEKLLVSTVAFLNREWVLSRFYVLVLLFHFLFLPVILPASAIARRLMWLEDEREDDEEDRESEEKAFIDVATEQGIIEEEEKELIQGVLDFGDTLVREIMTPRTDIAGVEESVCYDELIALFSSAKHSRMPVYRRTMDDIIGIVHLKDIMGLHPDDFELSRCLQKPFYVPETKKVDDLLREMQKARTKMAVVLDEYGGTAGIVTIEDLMEEIVGEIEDEHDSHREEIRKLDDDVWLVDGKCNLEDLEEESGIDLAIDEIDTVGGAAFSIFGRIPEEGDSIEWKNYRLTVEKMKRRRVQSVRIERIGQ